jgi:hypothetical protein
LNNPIANLFEDADIAENTATAVLLFVAAGVIVYILYEVYEAGVSAAIAVNQGICDITFGLYCPGGSASNPDVDTEATDDIDAASGSQGMY